MCGSKGNRNLAQGTILQRYSVMSGTFFLYRKSPQTDGFVGRWRNQRKHVRKWCADVPKMVERTCKTNFAAVGPGRKGGIWTHIERGREQELILANRRVTVPSEMYTTQSMKCLDTTMFVHAAYQYVCKKKTRRFGNALSYLQRLPAEWIEFLESVMTNDETRVHPITLRERGKLRCVRLPEMWWNLYSRMKVFHVQIVRRGTAANLNAHCDTLRRLREAIRGCETRAIYNRALSPSTTMPQPMHNKSQTNVFA